MEKKCDGCESKRIVNVSGKCSDLFSATYMKSEYEGGVTSKMGIGGGDYMEFSYCLECGKIQGDFPKPDPYWVRKKEADYERRP